MKQIIVEELCMKNREKISNWLKRAKSNLALANAGKTSDEI